MINKQVIIYLINYSSNIYDCIIFSGALFLEKETMQLFVSSFVSFFSFSNKTLLYRSSISFNFLVLNISRNISSRPTSFLLFNFFSTVWSSSFVNCLSLMSSWQQKLFFGRFICDSWGVPNRLLKCFFPLLKSFFLTDSFLFSSRGAFPSANFIYCLTCKPRFSIF